LAGEFDLSFLAAVCVYIISELKNDALFFNTGVLAFARLSRDVPLALDESMFSIASGLLS
jgi:hypothetical protein